MSSLSAPKQTSETSGLYFFFFKIPAPTEISPLPLPDALPIFVDPAADVSLHAHLGRWVVVGPRASVAEDAEIEDSVLLAGCRVEAGAKIRDSILGPGAVIGRDRKSTRLDSSHSQISHAGSCLK